jgi:fatty-acid peroxygenase
MVDGFGTIGTRYFKGKNARNRTEQWIAGLIDEFAQALCLLKVGQPFTAWLFTGI